MCQQLGRSIFADTAPHNVRHWRESRWWWGSFTDHHLQNRDDSIISVLHMTVHTIGSTLALQRTDTSCFTAHVARTFLNKGWLNSFTRQPLTITGFRTLYLVLSVRASVCPIYLCVANYFAPPPPRPALENVTAWGHLTRVKVILCGLFGLINGCIVLLQTVYQYDVTTTLRHTSIKILKWQYISF